MMILRITRAYINMQPASLYVHGKKHVELKQAKVHFGEHQNLCQYWQTPMIVLTHSLNCRKNISIVHPPRERWKGSGQTGYMTFELCQPKLWTRPERRRFSELANSRNENMLHVHQPLLRLQIFLMFSLYICIFEEGSSRTEIIALRFYLGVT